MINNKLFKYLLPSIIYFIFIIIMYKNTFNGVLSICDNAYIWPWSNYPSLSTWKYPFLGADRLSFMSMIVYMYLFKLGSSLLTGIGFSNIISSHIINLLPIYLCMLVYFFISYKISGNILVSYLAGFFIIMNNFTLEHLLIWPGVVFISLISYGLTIYTLHKIYLYGFDLRYSFVIVFVAAFHFHPFFFIAQLLLIFSFFVFYILINSHDILKPILNSLFVLLGTLIIGSYWLVPFFANLIFSSSNTVYFGNQGGVLKGYMNIAGVINQILLRHYPPGMLDIYSEFLTSLFYFFIIGSLFYLIFIVLFNETSSKEYLWLMFLSCFLLIVLTLSMGPNSPITGQIWMYLYDNCPGFGFFRSFTRFLILYVPVVIFAFSSINSIATNNYKYIINFIIVIYLLLASPIFISGDFNENIKGIQVPREYFDLNKNYFLNDPSQYNILIYPNTHYEKYTWSRTKKPDIYQQTDVFRTIFFSKPAVFNELALQMDLSHPGISKIFDYDSKFYFFPEFDKIVDNLNIKYILIQNDVYDFVSKDPLINSFKYYNYCINNPHYLLRAKTKYYSLFENANYEPILRLSGGNFIKDSSIKYHIFLNNLSGNRSIELLQNTHNGWKLFLIPNPNQGKYHMINHFNISATNECKSLDEDWIDFSDIGFLIREPLISQKSQDPSHSSTGLNNTRLFLNNRTKESLWWSKGYLNAWEINPESIINMYNSKFYNKTATNEINIELVLIFLPQAYFLLGLIITIMMLSICVIGQIYCRFRLAKKW